MFIHHPSCFIMFKDAPLSSLYLLFGLVHLCERGKTVEVLGNIRIIDGAVVLCHFQSAMTQQLLEHKCITTAINKVFPGKGMPI